MSRYEIKKQDLIMKSKKLYEFVLSHFSDANYTEQISQFIEDMQEDEWVITVLGEFKRGKSSLLNAILQEEILPTDVTPTTALIHTIRNSQTRSLEIHYVNQDATERQQFTNKTLKDFTFEANKNINDIHHLSINLPVTRIMKGTVLIDTPGVGDLNEHQLDITYNYIPRSDLILFIFDVTTPLRKSEMTYLTDTVLKLKFGDIIFVANFIDRLDDDELDETLEYLRKKLQSLLPDEEITLIPVSSKIGLEDVHDIHMQELIQFVNQRLEQGIGSGKKLQFFEKRFEMLTDVVRKDVQRSEQMKAASMQELELMQVELINFRDRKGYFEDLLVQYIEQRQTEFTSIINKSLDYFSSELSEQIRNLIDFFEGPNLDKYIEKQVPYLVKNRVRSWINQYLPKIDILLMKLQQEVSRGIEDLCQRQIKMFPAPPSSTENLYMSDIAFSVAHRAIDPVLKTGLIVGGFSVFMAITGIGLLIPVLSMAGLPFLNKFLAGKRLEQMKQEILIQVSDEIYRVTQELNHSLVTLMLEGMEDIKKRALLQIDDYIRSYEYSLEVEFYQRKSQPLSGVTTYEFERQIGISE